jgi:hypothetical protein
MNATKASEFMIHFKLRSPLQVLLSSTRELGGSLVEQDSVKR